MPWGAGRIDVSLDDTGQNMTEANVAVCRNPARS